MQDHEVQPVPVYLTASNTLSDKERTRRLPLEIVLRRQMESILGGAPDITRPLPSGIEISVSIPERSHEGDMYKASTEYGTPAADYVVDIMGDKNGDAGIRGLVAFAFYPDGRVICRPNSQFMRRDGVVYEPEGTEKGQPSREATADDLKVLQLLLTELQSVLESPFGQEDPANSYLL